MGCVSERGALLAARWGTQAVQQMNPELGESTTLDGASMDVCINFAQFIGWWGVFKARSYAATQNLRSTPLAPECVCAHARRASGPPASERALPIRWNHLVLAKRLFRVLSTFTNNLREANICSHRRRRRQRAEKRSITTCGIAGQRPAAMPPLPLPPAPRRSLTV